MELAQKKIVKPGEPCPDSGQYRRVGPRGGDPGGGEITGVRGKPMPPTPKPGQGYKIVDPTKHKK
jgi:hypothetical protein